MIAELTSIVAEESSEVICLDVRHVVYPTNVETTSFLNTLKTLILAINITPSIFVTPRADIAIFLNIAFAVIAFLYLKTKFGKFSFKSFFSHF